MATKKNDTATTTPAQVLREQKAKIEEIHANSPRPPRMPTERHPASDAAEAAGAARKAIGDIEVPITLARACSLIGHDVQPDDFVATAFDSIATDIDTLSDLAEHESGEAGYYGWSMFQQLAERARFAGEVAGLLDAEPTESTEVQS